MNETKTEVRPELEPLRHSALTVDELLRLEDLHYKMAGQPNPHKHAPAHEPYPPREPR